MSNDRHDQMADSPLREIAPVKAASFPSPSEPPSQSSAPSTPPSPPFPVPRVQSDNEATISALKIKYRLGSPRKNWWDDFSEKKTTTEHVRVEFLLLSLEFIDSQ